MWLLGIGQTRESALEERIEVFVSSGDNKKTIGDVGEVL